MKTNIVKFPTEMRNKLGDIKDNDPEKTNYIEVVVEACENLIKESKDPESNLVYEHPKKYESKSVTEVNLSLEDKLHSDLKVYAITCGVKGITLRKVIFFACQRLIDNVELPKK